MNLIRLEWCFLLLDIISGGFNITNIISGIIGSLIVIFLTLPIHEFAHGFVANKLGDPTARYQGRLTLNPVAHIDLIGSLCILLIGFGWAKPVPINSYYFKNPKRDIAITALAGPVSNLLMALIAALVSNVFVFLVGLNHIAALYAALIFQYVALINISLAVFNLIPIPPLDGSRILSAFLPNRIYYELMRYERFLVWGILILAFTGVLNAPITNVTYFLYDGINYIAGLPFLPFI